MEEQKKKRFTKTKYPPIQKEIKDLMVDEFWSGAANKLIELIENEINVIKSEVSEESILEELAFYRLAYRLEVLQVKSKARANQEKRLIAIKSRDQHAENLFINAVKNIKNSNHKVTYKSIIKELEKMESPLEGHAVLQYDIDNIPFLVSNTFLKERLRKFNATGE